jgi:hypothetical protein
VTLAPVALAVASAVPDVALVGGAAAVRAALRRALRADVLTLRYRPAAVGRLAADPVLRGIAAQAWREAVAGRPSLVRVALTAVPAPAALALLPRLRQVSGVGAAYVAEASLEPDAQWRWPLRIGVLPGPAGESLATAVAEDRMLRRLADVVVLGGRSRDCDLTARAGRRRPGRALDTVGVDANCLALLGLRRDPAALAATAAAARRVAASGCFRVPAGAPVRRWLYALVRNLSHDDPLDVALAGARVRADLVAHPNLVARGLMSATLEVLGRDARGWAGPGGRPHPVVPPPLLLHELPDLSPAAAPAVELFEQVAAAADGLVCFDRESHGGSAVADLVRSARDAGVREPPRRPEERFLQAEVHERGGARRSAAFRPGVSHDVLVWIGPGLAGHRGTPTGRPRRS